MGYNDSGATISNSYSTGQPSGTGSTVGGLLAWDDSPVGNLKANYWDTTTSGITSLSQGAGNIPNDRGITGHSTKRLTAMLSKGFSKKVWKESAKINAGLPYLISLARGTKSEPRSVRSLMVWKPAVPRRFRERRRQERLPLPHCHANWSG